MNPPRLDALQVGATDANGKVSLGIDLSSVIASPALQINSGVFGNNSSAADVDLKDMPASHLHPACWRYFLIREPAKKHWEFNPKIQHPAFFTSEYSRKSSRHSSLAVAAVKVMRNYPILTLTRTLT